MTHHTDGVGVGVGVGDTPVVAGATAGSCVGVAVAVNTASTGTSTTSTVASETAKSSTVVAIGTAVTKPTIIKSVGDKALATAGNPAGLPEEALRALRGESEASPVVAAPVLYINPMTSAIVKEDDYVAGAAANLLNLVIVGNDGALYSRKSFSYGRHVTIKLGQVFPAKVGAVSKIKEGMQYLAHGIPVPMEMLDQILAFFRKVMTDKIKATASSTIGTTGSYEAMAHIVWNDEQKAYRIAIPTQRVSQAAVHYDFTHILPGEEIIVDIHSHNNMGAFFSGTDNGDDRNMISVSGVAGKLSSAECELKWRYNIGKGQSIDLTSYKNIFSQTVAEVDVPDEWMDKVTTSYAGGAYGLGVHGGFQGGRYGNGYNYGAGARGANVLDDEDDLSDFYLGQSANARRPGGASDPARFPLANASVSGAKKRGRKPGSGSGKGKVKAIEGFSIVGLTKLDMGDGEYMYRDQHGNCFTEAGVFVGKHAGMQGKEAGTHAQDAGNNGFSQDAYENLVADMMSTNKATVTEDFTKGRNTDADLGTVIAASGISKVTHLDDDDDEPQADDNDIYGSETPPYVNVAFREAGDTSTLIEHDDMAFGFDELCHIATYARPADIEEFILFAIREHLIDPGDLDFLHEASVYAIDDPVEDIQLIIEENVHDDDTLAQVIAMVQEVVIELE